MNDINNSPDCERASDLIAFVYNEANESEARHFEVHLKECVACRQEVASFGVVRESITAWRDEALSGFVSTPIVAPVRKKSAIAALREFFDLSPLWLKGATAFAVLTFCLLAVLALNGTERGSIGSISKNTNAIYTQADIDRAVKEALAKHESSAPSPEGPVILVHSPKPKRATTPVAKSRRPLTRAEREQLAADLRLLSPDDESGLNLLADRINQ
jgi:anti-sigma factor RsiW